MEGGLEGGYQKSSGARVIGGILDKDMGMAKYNLGRIDDDCDGRKVPYVKSVSRGEVQVDVAQDEAEGNTANAGSKNSQGTGRRSRRPG